MDHVWKLENNEERKLLRSKARPFDFSEMTKKQINDLVIGMRKLMRKANGVGLSANQAGYNFSMFVAEVPDEKKGGRKFYAIFNPKLEKIGKEQEAVEEGCLSVPGTWGPVKRHIKVQLTGFDKNGKPVFGAEVKKEMAVSSSNSQRKKWTENMLLEDAENRYSTEEFRAFKKIYDFSKQHADEVRLGTGAYGSFNPIFKKVCDKSLYTLTTDGRLCFNFHWIYDKTFLKKYGNAMLRLGFSIPENYPELHPSVRTDEWVPRVDEFLSAISEMLG